MKNNPPAKIESYLNFNGRAEEAIEFYRRTLGAEVLMMMRFKDNPEPPPAGTQSPGTENKIMHASLKIGETTLMLSDGRCTGKTSFEGFHLSIPAASAADAERYFNGLADGGQVHMPLAKTFFSPAFGMLADRFGLGWMVLVPAQS